MVAYRLSIFELQPATMFFILSKILLFLLSPINWILICIAIAYFTKKQLIRKRMLVTAGILFFVFSNFWLFSICMKAWQPKAEHIVYNKSYTAGIVLCGMTAGDKNGDSFFGSNADRFLQTCRLYHTGVIHKIFISGGDGSLLQNKPKEADFLRKEFIAQNIPDSVLIVEHNSRNTYESAVEAKHYLDSLHIDGPYILITSAEHMKRSIATFKKYGINVIAHPAGFRVVNSNLSFADYVVPNIGVLSDWKSLLKEMIGMLTYKISGKA